MYFRHSETLWQEFPRLVPAALVLDPIEPPTNVDHRLEPWLDRARGRQLAGFTDSVRGLDLDFTFDSSAS